MNESVTKDFGWQRNYLPAMKRIIGENLVGEAPSLDDQERNTDLIVLRLEAVRIACRVRRYEQIRYASEFTIRASRPSGADTELAKLISGWGNYILYGFAEAEGCELAAWVLGDLNVFRLWRARYAQQYAGKEPGMAQRNHDGSSAFRAYRIDSLPAAFVVARKAYPGRQEAA